MTTEIHPDPRCGKCGYIVRGLTTLNCPECGGDLSVVGVLHGPLPSRLRRARPLLTRILIWTAIVGALYLAAVPLVRRYGPIEYFQAVVIKVSASKSAIPNFDLYAQDDRIQWCALFEPPKFRPVRMNMLLQHTRAESGINISPTMGARSDSPDLVEVTIDRYNGSWTFSFTDPQTKTPVSAFAVNLSDVGKWMQSRKVPEDAGYYAAQEALRRFARLSEVNGLLAAVEAAQSVPELNVRRSGISFHVPRWSPYLTTAVLFAPLWLAGMFMIRRRYRRIGKAAAAKTVTLMGSRTLTVMFVDMVEYSARTSRASREELIALLRAEREMVEPVAKLRGGKIVKSLGDGRLLTFESATEAVLAAVTIQRRAREFNTARASNSASLQLRIGISTGEVSLHDDDIYGDCVNMASRIEALAPAGDVYFSEATFQSLNRAEARHEFVGEFELKGSPGKVRIYCARVD
jgi:class 3 adenylate cyclase